ncbi:MAG: glycosyltransferase, partial [Cyanobacteria bacterium P01_F01_bin.4]
MRILVASHTYIVDLNCEKYRALAQLAPDVEVTLVVPKRWNPGGVQNRIVEPEYKEEGSFRVVPVSNFSQNNQGLLSFGLDLVTLLREFRPHIIQAEQGAKALAYAEFITLNRLLGLKAKNLFFTWWNLPYELKFPVSLLESYNLKQTDGIVVGNQDGADILRQRGYGGPMCVMPQLGVDESIFAPQSQPELRSQLGIVPTDFIIGFVGRFVPEKGLSTLFKALATIKDLSWKIVLLGRGPLKDSLKQQATELGINHRISWVESVPHDDVPR